MMNTLVGPVLFATVAGIWGFINRPEQREHLLFALILLLITAGGVYRLYPSDSLFALVAGYALVVSVLLALLFQGTGIQRAEAPTKLNE